jgi:hypothetical protein
MVYYFGAQERTLSGRSEAHSVNHITKKILQGGMFRG